MLCVFLLYVFRAANSKRANISDFKIFVHFHFEGEPKFTVCRMWMLVVVFQAVRRIGYEVARVALQSYMSSKLIFA